MRFERIRSQNVEDHLVYKIALVFFKFVFHNVFFFFGWEGELPAKNEKLKF